jgi:hypothetical protein
MKRDHAGLGSPRRLGQLGVECQVVAPSLTPTRSGERVKQAERPLTIASRASEFSVEVIESKLRDGQRFAPALG